MSGDAILILSLAITVAIIVIGGWAGRSRSRNLEGWLVHSRGMGSLLLWFLLGSEIYTAFTFQGLAGYSYSNGAAGFYNIAQNDVAYAIAFLILPCIWALGKKYGHVTQADFVASRYDSRALGVFVAFTSAIIMIAYIDLNIEGLAAIFSVIGGNGISPDLANVLAFIILGISVYLGGIRGNAIQSVVKDVLMFIAIAAIFIVVPLHYFSGFGGMYGGFTRHIPHYFELPGITPHLGPAWLITTVLINALGQWMWPQWFGTAFTANSPRTIKRQAVWMPWYQLVKVAVVTVGLAAVVALGTGMDGNNVIMTIAQRIFPTWVLIVVVIAAMLAAIVPAGPIVMTSASLLARNVIQEVRPATTDRAVFWITRGLVFPLTAAALGVTLWAPALIVDVLLVAYTFIAQLFPGVVIGGIFWSRANKYGVFAGLITGWAVSGWLQISGQATVDGLNSGFVGLLANAVVFVVVSLAIGEARARGRFAEAIREVARDGVPVGTSALPATSTVPSDAPPSAEGTVS